MQHRFLIPITALLAMTLLASNTLDTKIFTVAGLNLPAGIILFPLAYLAGDILTEVYGYAVARRVIWSGMISLVVGVAAYEIARHLPPAAFYTNEAAFDATLSHVPRLVLASISAYLCGEFTNSYIVAKMKVATNGRLMPLRFVLSTVAAEAVDTAVFIAIAFSWVMTVEAMLSVFLAAWAIKVGWEVAALPVTIPLVKWLKRAENQDHFDRGTNFSPFRL